MSLFGSLTTAVSGLDAQQDALGNISNNIANSQTIGYKDVGTAFDELVTQSNQQYNAPGGVSATPVYMNSLAGSLASSQTTTNLAVSGNGYFVVKAPPSTTAAGASNFNGENLYTRAGDFQLNKNNYLVNSAGYYLEGYAVNPATGATNTASLQPIQVSQSVTQPQTTSNLYLSANLPAGLTTTAGATGYTPPSPITETVYDTQGNPYTMTVQLDYMGKGSGNNVTTPPTNLQDSPTGTAGMDKWQASVTITPAQAGTAGSTTSPYVVDMYFNTTASGAGTPGTLAQIDPAASVYNSASTTPTTPATTGFSTIATAITSGAATMNLGFFTPGDTTSGPAVPDLPIKLNFGTMGSSTVLGSNQTQSSMTEYNGTDVSVASKNQDGFEAGNFQGVSIDANGYVSVNYTNGTTLKYFQVPLAQFNAPQDLDRTTGSVFAQTTDSGQPQIGVAGANGAGTITPSEVEQSNVNIAGEFTKLIVAQQAYSANSKVITTTNELLSSLLSIVQ